MKSFVALVALVLLSALPAAAQSNNFTGTWVGVVRAAEPGGQAPSQNGGPLPFIVQMIQQGDTVKGELAGIGGGADVPIQEAKIEGNRLTFVGVRQIQNQDVTFRYTATLDGDKLEFRIERDGAAPLASTTTRLTTAW